MFFIINIVFILLVFRILLNGKVLKRLMEYHWGFLLKFQHVLFFIFFFLITFFTENYFLDAPELVWSVLFVIIFNIGIYYLVYFYLVPGFIFPINIRNLSCMPLSVFWFQVFLEFYWNLPYSI